MDPCPKFGVGKPVLNSSSQYIPTAEKIFLV